MNPFPPLPQFASPTGEKIPEYHDAMLEVRLRTDVGPLGGEVALGGPMMLTRSAAATSTGLGMLLSFERSGLIRRVVSLAEDTVAAAGGETPLLATFAAAARPRHPDDPNAGVTLIELYRDQDTQVLETELRRDPAVESVSKVPIRFLLAKKKAAPRKKSSPKRAASSRKAAAGATIAAAPPTGALWNLAKIRWAQARQHAGFKDATNIKVAVLDTGIDLAHPDRPINIAGYEFTHPTTANASSSRDIIGHGTHVAGTIAANLNNSVGISGICNCAIYALKIFDDGPDYSASAGYFVYFVDPAMYQRALARCRTLAMNVVNLSIGGYGAPSANESLLFNKLLQSGTTIVAAMGNDNSSQPSYPAAIPGVVAVGATSINDVRASFSNFGGHISICAPGQGIWSTLPTYPGNTGYWPKNTFPVKPDLTRPMSRDTDYASWDGTSMATPHVTGAVALLLAANGAMSPAAVKQRLESRARKVPAMQGQNFSQEYGYGRLDVFRLLWGGP